MRASKKKSGTPYCELGVSGVTKPQTLNPWYGIETVEKRSTKKIGRLGAPNSMLKEGWARGLEFSQNSGCLEHFLGIVNTE